MATKFKALGAGNGFPRCLGNPVGGVGTTLNDYDSSSLNDVSLKLAMKYCWNIKSVTFGPLTFDLTQNVPDYWTYPNYEPKSLALDPTLASAAYGRYAADDTSINDEVFEIIMGIGSALTVGGVRKYFHGITLVHNNFARDGSSAEIVTKYTSRPNFTAAQVAAKNFHNVTPEYDGAPGEEEQIGNTHEQSTFTQSVVTMGGIPNEITFLKTVHKTATEFGGLATGPSFNYPPDTAPTTASFTFFDY